jgi:hypothetical protein
MNGEREGDPSTKQVRRLLVGSVAQARQRRYVGKEGEKTLSEGTRRWEREDKGKIR